MNLRPALVIALALGLLLVSCRRAKPGASEESARAAPAAPAAAVTFDAAQQARLPAFASKLADLINDGQLAELAALVEIDSILDAALADVDTTSNTDVREFRAGFMSGLRREPRQLFRGLEGARTRFLRVRESPDGPGLLIRSLGPDGSCTYLEFFPRPATDGTFSIREIHNHATGLTLRETIRSTAISLIAGLDVSVMDRLFGGKEKIDGAAFTRFAEALKRRDAQAAKAMFPNLPAGVRQSRPIFMSYLYTLAHDPDDASYLAALEEGQKLFPGDPALDFLAIDLHFLKKEFAACDAALQRIAERLGPDAHLLTLRAGAAMKTPDFARAAKLVDEALELEPDFENAHDVRFQLGVMTGDYARACAALDDLNRVSDKTWRAPDLNEPEYRRFAGSPEYRTWLERQGE